MGFWEQCCKDRPRRVHCFLKSSQQGSAPCPPWQKLQEEFESAHSVAQLCPTLCDPTDCSPPGSSVHGIFQSRILEWVAFPSPGELPDPGVEPGVSCRWVLYHRVASAYQLPWQLSWYRIRLQSVQETPVWFLGQDDLLERGRATHSSILGLRLWLSR